MKKVEVAAHNLKWRETFEKEAGNIAAALCENVVAIHHIGSTAIPNIYAKPIIDFLIEVTDISEIDTQNSAMESLGYEVMGEFGIVGRRYFRKDNQEGIRIYHVHTFESGSEEISRHLAFRDYMIAHPEEAHQYSNLKRKLAEEYPQNPDGYMDGKNGYIKEIDRKAAKWCKPKV